MPRPASFACAQATRCPHPTWPPPSPPSPPPPPALPCLPPAETRRVPGPALRSLSGSQPFDENPASVHGCLRPAPPMRGRVLSITPTPPSSENTQRPVRTRPHGGWQRARPFLFCPPNAGDLAGRAQAVGAGLQLGRPGWGAVACVPATRMVELLPPPPGASGGKDIPSPAQGPRPPSHSDAAAFSCSEASPQDGREPTARPRHTGKGTPHQREPPLWTSRQDERSQRQSLTCNANSDVREPGQVPRQDAPRRSWQKAPGLSCPRYRGGPAGGPGALKRPSSSPTTDHPLRGRGAAWGSQTRKQGQGGGPLSAQHGQHQI